MYLTFVGKSVFKQHRGQRGPPRNNEVLADLRLDTTYFVDDVRSDALERTPVKALWTVGDVAGRHTYVVAAFSLSAIGLLGAFGQKPDQMS